MPKTRLFTWLKNVNKQCFNGSKISDISSPISPNTIITFFTNDVQPGLIRTSVHFLNQFISTPKPAISNPLNISYTHYPLSLLLEPLKKI